MPDDLSIVGFDDHPLAAPFGLTTMRQPIDAITESAVTRLIQRIEKRQRKQERRKEAAQSTRFAVDLVVRRSTAPPAGRGPGS